MSFTLEVCQAPVFYQNNGSYSLFKGENHAGDPLRTLAEKFIVPGLLESMMQQPITLFSGIMPDICTHFEMISKSFCRTVR